MKVGVGGTFTRVEIIESLFGEVNRINVIECFGVVVSEFSGQLTSPLRRERIGTLRNAGLKKVGGAGPHLVEIQNDIRLPEVKFAQSPLRLWMDRRKPVAIQVEPVVIHTPTRPRLPVLAVH